MSANDDVISLAELMRHQPEMLVKPLFWTSRHLELIGCRFRHVHNAPSIEDTHDDQRPLQGKHNERECDARSLANSFSLPVKLNALKNILLSEGSIFNECSKGTSFSFGGHPVHRPLYTLFYHRGHPDRSACQEPLPVIGYLNYTNVTGTRYHKFSPRDRVRDIDYGISPLYKKKLARVTPKEWKEDPYFVCVLLSLAQFQEHCLKPPGRASHLSRLLVVSPMDREFIHLYEAQITSDFLAMFDKPATATTQTNFHTVQHRQIPFTPFETFQERILSELSSTNNPSHVSNQHNLINQDVKRAPEQDDDERCKRARTS